MRLDTASVDQAGGSYRRARNMILDDLAGTLANEKAPEYLPLKDTTNNVLQNMEIAGQFRVPGDRIVFGVHARDLIGFTDYWDVNQAEQIIEFDPETETHTVLASGVAGTFGFDADAPFQGVGYVNAADELILVWTDGINKPKYINTSDTSTGPLLVFPEADYPMARPVANAANLPSGKVLNGAWTFIMAYEVVSGTENLTQYSPAMGSFRVGADTGDETATTRTALKFKMYGLDTRYEYARMYAVRSFNGVEIVYYADRITITDTDLEWSYIGQDRGNAPSSDALFIDSATYQTAQTLTVSDDRLFMGNLSIDAIDYETGQAVANEIVVNWSVDEVGLTAQQWDNVQRFGTVGTNRALDYTGSSWVKAFNNRSTTNKLTDTPYNVHTDVQGMLGGFMPDEVYALYISFLMKDGTWSRAFHIPGGGTLNAADTLGAVQDIEQGAGVTNTYLGGQCGYVANSSENYPNDTAFNTTQHGDLRNAAVRHHLMPTPAQMWSNADSNSIMNSNFEQEWANSTLSLFFTEVDIPQSIADQIQGFKFFYAKKNVNERRIKAYVPTWRWDSAFTSNQDYMRIYDPYLLTQTPSISDWSIKEVYKGMSYEAQLNHTFASADISDYAFLPANIDEGTFDNTNRERCLALLISEDMTIANDWHAGYPGFVRAGVAELITLSSYTGHGWHTQTTYDTTSTDYPERTAGAGIIGDNFTSTFGSYMNVAGAANLFNYDSRPTRNNTTYGYVYDGAIIPTAASTRYNTTTLASVGAGALVANTYHGFGGIMGSYSAIWEDKDDYHLNFEYQDLVATHDLVFVDSVATYRSNQVVRGGDVWITPVTVEFMHAVNTDEGDPQDEDCNDNTSYDRLRKISYFTWSPVLPGLNDIQQQFTWDDLVTYSETTNNFFNGETLNDYVIGDHHFKNNDSKPAFPKKLNSLDATMLPNRIIRSAKQNYESTQFAWGTFAPADYYDNALSKDSIENLEDYNGDLIIHHGNAIYKTRSKFNIDASGTNVFVGTGDIFQAPPQELVPDNAGYAGVYHWSDTLLCRIGYVWVDRNAGKVFKLGQTIEELSANGLNDYFRDTFIPLSTSAFFGSTGPNTAFSASKGGFALGYDPEFDRILLTRRRFVSSVGLTTRTGSTISYSVRNGCWTSLHDYAPYAYMQSYNQLFMLDEIDWAGVYVSGDNYLNNLTGLFKLNGANPGVRYDDTEAVDTGNVMPSSVDVAFNMSPANSKVWQNFNWVTRNGAGEGREHAELNTTFDRVRVFNDTQVSQYVDAADFRRTDNRWNVNAFRDDAKGSLVSDSWFSTVQPGGVFKDDILILDTTKNWWTRGRFISDYATIRLEALNTDGNRLYLLDVGAAARLARR
jgi:hypothetical protein